MRRLKIILIRPWCLLWIDDCAADRGLRRTTVTSGCYDVVSHTVALTPSSAPTCEGSHCSPPPAHNPPTDVCLLLSPCRGELNLNRFWRNLQNITLDNLATTVQKFVRKHWKLTELLITVEVLLKTTIFSVVSEKRKLDDWLSQLDSLAISRTDRCVPGWLSWLRTSDWIDSMFDRATLCIARTMLSQDVRLSVCPSVCHKLVFYRNG